MGNGYVKIFRKFIEWEWYHDINCRILFLHCLLRANYEKQKFEGKIIPKGSFVTSISNLAKEIGITPMQTRLALSKLKITREITQQITSRYSIITLNNWEAYQTEQHAKQQTDNTRITTIKEIKKRRRVDINISSSSSSEIFEKISEEEEELLKKHSKRNKVKYFKSWLRKVLENGDYVEILEKERKRQERERQETAKTQKIEVTNTPEDEERIKEIQKKIKEKRKI